MALARPLARARHRPHPGLASRAATSRSTGGVSTCPSSPLDFPDHLGPPRRRRRRAVPRPRQFAGELATDGAVGAHDRPRRPGLRSRALQQPLGPSRQRARRPPGPAPVDHRALRPRPARARPQGADRRRRAVDRRPSPSAKPWPTSSAPAARTAVRIVPLSVDLDRFGPGPGPGRPPPPPHLRRAGPARRDRGSHRPRARASTCSSRPWACLQGAAARCPSGRGGQRRARPRRLSRAGAGRGRAHPRRPGRASSAGPTTFPARCAPSTSS